MTDHTPWNAPDGSTPQPPPAAPMVPNRRSYRRGGIGFGVLLIALGVVFLLAQLVPGFAWWQMWPFFIVAVGVVQIVTPDARDGWGISRVFDGIGTVLVGSVLLGNTTGFISWGVWWTLLTLWPVLLIALGISLVGRALGQSWLRVISPVVIWVALAYAVATSLTGMGGYQPIAPVVIQSPGEAFSFSAPVGNVRAATLTLDGGVGEITVGSASDSLVEAHGTSPFGKPAFLVNRSGDTADVKMGLGDQHAVVLVPGFTAGKVDVRLSDSVVWDASLNTGVTNLNADFSHVRLSALTLKTGVSNADLQLGPLAGGVSRPKIVVKAGVSSVTIRIPRYVEARVVTNGLSTLDVSSDLKSVSNNTWATAGYSGSGPAYDISVESGVGNVSIRTY